MRITAAKESVRALAERRKWEDFLHIRQEICMWIGMGMPPKQKEWADKARQFIKAELKRRSVGEKELADRLRAHRLEGSVSGIGSKLS